ncbi:MAG: tape measure protein, partial [Lactobacillus sp.]|nr:tape measure protein [Lactobacillus sp.]
MAKADGSVLISLDIDDNTKAPIEKVESRLKGVGSSAGDKIDDSMKSNTTKAEETAKKASNVIEGDFKKPVTQDIKVDSKQAMSELKSIETTTAKTIKGDNDIKVKVTGDANGKIKDIFENTNKIPNSKDIDIDAKGNAPEKIKETADEMDNASNKSLKLKDVISGTFIGGALTQGIGMATSALGDLGGEAVTASDAVYKFQSTMKLGGFGSKEIKDSTKEVQKYANDTVYDLATVSNTTAQLAANGVKGYMGLTEAAGNLNAQAGGNADTFKSVAMMLTQTAGAGKLTTENWNQLADAIPGASGVLQKQMKKNGAFTGNFRDAMAAGKISSDEFNKAITQLGMNDGAKKAAKSTTTFEGSIGNLEAGV